MPNPEGWVDHPVCLRRGPAHVPVIRDLGIHPRVAAELIELGEALAATMRYAPRFIFLGEIRSEAAARQSLADPVRSIIRSGRVEQLGTEIASQLNRILNGAGATWPS